MKNFNKLAASLQFIILAIAILLISSNSKAQTYSNPVKTYHVGIFAPLYLDSVFSTNGNFKYKHGIPKLIIPGLEFVQGAQLAMDSAGFINTNIIVTIYDSKSYTNGVASLIQSKKIDSLDVIIGAVKDVEFKQLADFALLKKIPFISATYPNDGGITNNPYVVIVSPTLKAHCEAIYSYLLENHGADKIYLIRKKGTQEDKIADYFKQINNQDGKPLLNIQTLNFDIAQQNADFIKSKLDSAKQTIIIGASLDENFGNALTLACHDLNKSYPITLIGMPNWDGFKQLTKGDVLDDFPVYYTSAYYNNKLDENSKTLIHGFMDKYKSKPTDFAFKGYECASLFTNLLIQYPTTILDNLNDKNFKVFSDYNFQPIMVTKKTTPDYIENKHLYFIRIEDGNFTKAW